MLGRDGPINFVGAKSILPHFGPLWGPRENLYAYLMTPLPTRRPLVPPARVLSPHEHSSPRKYSPSPLCAPLIRPPFCMCLLMFSWPCSTMMGLQLMLNSSQSSPIWFILGSMGASYCLSEAPCLPAGLLCFCDHNITP